MCPSTYNPVFDLESRDDKDDEQDSSPHRSILGLEGIEFSPDRRAAVSASPSISIATPLGSQDPSHSAVFSVDRADREEESGRRSILGLEKIEYSTEWRAAIPASPRPASVAPRQTVPSRERSAAELEADEESGQPLLFGLERSEFALQRKPAAVSTLPGVLAPAPSSSTQTDRPAEPARKRLVERDLLSLRKPLDPSEIDPPHFEKDLELPTVRPIPFERAILLSLVAHVLLLLFLLWAPVGGAGGRRLGLLADWIPVEKPEDKIPIVFRSAPGPERENPKRSELSDKTRRAGGGDRSRPKSDTPFVPPRPGVEGLSPGAEKAPRAASSPSRTAQEQSAQKTAGAELGERARSAQDGFLVPPSGGAPSQTEGARIADLQRAIQDAARAVGARGQSGAGIPNPEGGFVDSGPISFDTSWYDWGAYAEEMVRRIKLHWDIPELARLGWKGRLTIRFFIMADGRVQAAKILAQSGIPPFDFAALQAILKSDPFRPLPKDLLAQVPGKDREGITVTFFYNIRPGKE